MTTCPLCGAGDGDVVARFSAADAAQHFVLAQQEPERHALLRDEIARLWNGPACANRTCATCGFGFADPYVAGSAAFYDLAFGASGYTTDKWDFARTMTALRDLDLTGAAVLEVGAGEGHFLDKLARPRKAAPVRCDALEYNRTALGILAGKAYAASSRDIGALRADGRRYRAIFLFQVLEHRDAVHETFADLAGLLEPGGRIYITVPNVTEIRFNEANGSLMDMPPNHIGRWSHANLRRAAADHGLAVTAADTEPHSAIGFVKRDVLYAYMRRAQRPGTLANRLYAARKGKAGRIANLAAMALNATRRIGVWRRAQAEAAALGPSIWVELRHAGAG